MGFSRGTDCALAMSGQVTKQIEEIARSVKLQMFLRFMYPPLCTFFSVKKRSETKLVALLTGRRPFGENHLRGLVIDHREIVK
jgi:hypothetical protein